MTPPQEIRDEAGYLTELGKQLGEERFHRFTQGQGAVQGMSLFLVMAVVTAPSHGYSDAALALIVQDAEDVRKAANDWADECIALADEWRRQRAWDANERGV